MVVGCLVLQLSFASITVRSITVSFVTGCEDFFSRHSRGPPRFAFLDESFDGGFSFGAFLVWCGYDVGYIFAVSRDDDGFASLDGAKEFGKSGFGFCYCELEHEVGIVTCCFNDIGGNGAVVGFRLSPE